MSTRVPALSQLYAQPVALPGPSTSARDSDGTGLVHTGRRAAETPRAAAGDAQKAAASAQSLGSVSVLPQQAGGFPSVTLVATCPHCTNSFHAQVVSTVHFLTETYSDPTAVQPSPSTDQLLALLAQQANELRALRSALNELQHHQRHEVVVSAQPSPASMPTSPGKALFTTPAANQPPFQTSHTPQAQPMLPQQATQPEAIDVTPAAAQAVRGPSHNSNGNISATYPNGYQSPDAHDAVAQAHAAQYPHIASISSPPVAAPAATGSSQAAQPARAIEPMPYDNVVNLSAASSAHNGTSYHAQPPSNYFQEPVTNHLLAASQQIQPAAPPVTVSQTLLPPQLAQGSLFYQRSLDGAVSAYSSRGHSQSATSAVNMSANHIDSTHTTNVSRSSRAPSAVSAYQRGGGGGGAAATAGQLMQPIRMVSSSSLSGVQSSAHQPHSGISNTHHNDAGHYSGGQAPSQYFGAGATRAGPDRSIANVSFHSDVPSGLYGAGLGSGDHSYYVPMGHSGGGHTGGLSAGNSFYQQARAGHSHSASQPRSANASNASAATSSRYRATNSNNNAASVRPNRAGNELDASMLDGYCSFESMEYMRKIGIL